MANRTSPFQFEIIIDYMEKYPQMLTGKVDSNFSKETKELRWHELAAVLNAEGGGPSKSIKNWRKTFKDWKCYVKRKVITLQQKQAEDGKPPKEKLSLTEERLLAAIGEFEAHGQKYVPGPPNYEDFDLGVSIDTDDIYPQDDMQNYGGIRKAVKRKIKAAEASGRLISLLKEANESQSKMADDADKKEKRMRIVIDTNLLIKEIEQRPAIWDMKLPDYSDKLARERCWEELTEIFSPENISEKERKNLNELLQKIWKNIHNRFVREKRDGEKSQYMYSPKLQFLQNSMKSRKYARYVNDVVSMTGKAASSSEDDLDVSEEESKPSPEKSSRTENSLEATTSDSSDTSSSFSDIPDVPEEESKPPPEKKARTDNSLVDTKLIEFLERNIMELQDAAKNNQDEDRLFLLSLLTNLKSIQPIYKLKAKIEILTILDRYPKVDEESDTVTQPQILEVRHSVDP